MTSEQLSEWEAYDRLDPIGTWRGDYQLAYISSLLTNLTISVHGKKGAKTTNPIDFMLNWDVEKKNEPKKQSIEEMKSVLLGIADTQNKRFKQMEKAGREDFMHRPPKRFRQTNNPKL